MTSRIFEFVYDFRPKHSRVSEFVSDFRPPFVCKLEPHRKIGVALSLWFFVFLFWFFKFSVSNFSWVSG